MSKSLKKSIVQDQEALSRKISSLAMRDDAAQLMDGSLLDIALTSFFIKGELSYTDLTQLLGLIKRVSKVKPELYTGTRLSLANLVLQRNEYLLVRRINLFHTFLKFLVNLGDKVELLHSENMKFIIDCISDSKNIRNFQDSGEKVLESQSLILVIFRNIHSLHESQLQESQIFSVLRSLIQQSKFYSDAHLSEEGLNFWLHKFIEDPQYKSRLIELIVSYPMFLLAFRIRNSDALDEVIDLLTKKRWYLDSLNLESLMQIFKGYRKYFQKSPQRMKLLDEKLQKELDSDYASKQVIDEYNEYFSNYMANINLEGGSMESKCVIEGGSPSIKPKDKFGRRGKNLEDSSLEYTTSGQRILVDKAKDFIHTQASHEKSDMKIKITEIEVTNVNPVELNFSELADKSLNQTKELVETIRRGSNKDLLQLCDQSHKVTPGKKSEMRKRLMFDSGHMQLSFEESFGEENIDHSTSTIQDISYDRANQSQAFVIKKEPSEISSRDISIKKINKIDKCSHETPVLHQKMSNKNSKCKMVEASPYTSYDSSILQPSSSVVMLESLPRSQRISSNEQNESPYSSKVEKAHEMSFGMFNRKKSSLGENSSTYMHNKLLVRSTLEKMEIENSSRDSHPPSLPSVDLQEKLRERRPFAKRNDSSLNNEKHDNCMSVKTSFQKFEEFEREHFSPVDEDKENTHRRFNDSNYLSEDNFDTFDKFQKYPTHEIEPIKVENINIPTQKDKKYVNKTQAIFNRFSKKQFKNWNRFHQNPSQVKISSQQNRLRVDDDLNSDHHSSQHSFQQFKSKSRIINPIDLRLDISRCNYVSPHKDIDDTFAEQSGDYYSRGTKEHSFENQHCNTFMKKIDLQDTKRTNNNCGSYVNLNKGYLTNKFEVKINKEHPILERAIMRNENNSIDSKKYFYNSIENLGGTSGNYNSDFYDSTVNFTIDERELPDYSDNGDDSELHIEILPSNSGYDTIRQDLPQSAYSYRSEFPESEFESNAGFRVSFYSFLKELLKNKDPFLNFDLEMALEHYSDRREFKEQLITFFKNKDIMNKTYTKNKMTWRRSQNFWLTHSSPDLKLAKVSNFISVNGCKKSDQYSWMSKINLKRNRTHFLMVANRSRKVLLNVKSLSRDTQNIQGRFLETKDIVSRCRLSVSRLLRPCLFFYNPKSQTLNYFDLLYRAHSKQKKIFSSDSQPPLHKHNSNHSRATEKLNSFLISGNKGFLRQRSGITQLSMLSFQEEKFYDVEEDILAMYQETGYLIMVPVSGNYLLYLDLQKQEFYKSIFSAMEDTLKNIGSMKVDPDKRLFVVRGDYSVMEINLKLELIKLRQFS